MLRRSVDGLDVFLTVVEFQWAPTLGGECYKTAMTSVSTVFGYGFNGHPPLGVNATYDRAIQIFDELLCFNGHPPLGVNATETRKHDRETVQSRVSMGTHPWG